MERPVRRDHPVKQVSRATTMTIRSIENTRVLVAASEGRMMRIIDHKSMSEGETHRTGKGWSFLDEALL